MARFSERMGITPPRSAIQVDSMDDPLRNRIWSIIYLMLDSRNNYMQESPRSGLYKALWINYFEYPIDTLPGRSGAANVKLREHFFGSEWWRAYNLLEFVLNNVSSSVATPRLVSRINEHLEQYLSGYRYVGDEIVPVIDESSIEAIESALTSPLEGVRTHLKKSMSLLALREAADPANSIKESILAVESLCHSILGKKSGTLADALKRMESFDVVLHGALKDSWLKLYGYTSDGDGIRHASQRESGATIDDAVYFLVSCSAFIGLLTAKATAAGIELKPVT